MHSKRLFLTVFVAAIALPWITAACALSKDDIINMKSVGVPDSIIISTIQSSDAVFNLSAEDIIELKKAGISDTVVEAMQSTSGDISRESRRVVEEPTPREEVRSSGSDDESRAGDDDDDDEEETRSSTRSRSRDDDEEDDDMIRGRRTRRDDREEDRDDRGEAKALAFTPPEIKEAIGQYKSKKYLSSSYNLYNILDSRKYPEQDVKIYYYLADSLYKMELYHSAQVYFIKVVGQGSGTYFAPALTKLVYIWRKTNDPTALVQLIGEVNPEDFPSKVRSDLMYLLGRRQFDEQNYRQALKFLEQVSNRSDHYIQAQYIQGVIYNRQGKLKQSVGKFVDILKETTVYGDPTEIEKTRHLALLNIGRIYYGIEQFDKAADKYYEWVPRESEYWSASLFEASWAYFMTEGRENRALGHIMTLESPFFADSYWMPEMVILKALIYYRICEYDEVGAILDGFEAEYGQVAEEIKTFIKPYADRELPPEHAYKTIYGKRSTYYDSLPQAIYAHIELDQQFMGPHQHVIQIERELEVIRSMKPQWKASPIGQALVDRLREDRQRYMKRAGIVLINKLNDVRKNLEGLMGQSALIRFEVASGEYRKYTEMFRNPDAVDIYEKLEFEFATNPEFVYWPFNDEFWDDELGYYIFTETGSCEQ
jgi:tetratricopeptide (TPR) repeat protein